MPRIRCDPAPTRRRQAPPERVAADLPSGTNGNSSPAPATSVPAGAPFVVLIPARLASTRLPNKPLADIGGKPMIVRVAEQASRSRATRVVVATDSPEVAAAVRGAQFEVVLTRDDHRSGTDRLAEAAGLLDLPDDAIVVNMQGDEPELPPRLLDAVADCLAADGDCPMATAAHAIDQVQDWFNPNVVKVVLDCRGNALYFSRAPVPYHRDGLKRFPAVDDADALRRAFTEAAPLRHIGLYAYRGGFLKTYSQMAPTALEGIEALEQLRVLFHGYSIRVVVTEEAPAAGIDTPEDLAAVRLRFDR